MFPINAAALPVLRTRQALLILDLQNDFVTPNGALAINEPDAIVSRIVKLAEVFRLSGAGDVIWIRSQFDGHRSLSGGVDGGDQIITTDAPLVPRRATSSRGRTPTSGRHEDAVMEADVEAFLSYPPGCEKAQCVRPDSDGAQFAAEVQQAVDMSRDVTFTKTHYSAFAAGQQLLQLLRARFVTEIYVCGALTNISIYATALDAGRHGYDITLIDDCCGYRSDMRHSNAVHRLMQLTGCEVTTASEVMAKLKPGQPNSEEKEKQRNAGREMASSTSGANEDDHLSKALPSSFAKLTISGESTSAPTLSSGSSIAQPERQILSPTAQQVPRSVVQGGILQSPPRKTPPGAAPNHRVKPVDSTPLEVDPDLSVSPDAAQVGDSPKIREQIRTGQKLSALRSNLSKIKGPPRVIIPPGSSLAAGFAARSAAIVRSTWQSRESPNQARSSSRSPDHAPDSMSNKAAMPTILDAENSPKTSSPTASDRLCEGDTTIIRNLLPEPLASTAFERLKAEVVWERMSHQGGEVPRLVAVQGVMDGQGNIPVYRHPADELPPLLPFSPTVLEIKAEVERHVGHPLNHVLIQFYRNGNDYISEHSDKTLDIVRGSFIANVSLGAERTMLFRTKRLDKDPSRKHGQATTGLRSGGGAAAAADEAGSEATATEEEAQKRRTERARLPHNSLCRMGLETNMRWLHAIRQDKRLDREKTEAEMAYGGARISLTFRRIGTFLDRTQSYIWGQGAVAKSKDKARPAINGQTPEAVRMLQAFGTENHSSEFDWDRYYGEGFDVVNIKASPRLFSSPDRVVNTRVAMMLAEFGVSYAKGSTGAQALGNDASIKFVDNDTAKSTVEGQVAIMLYLEAVYGGSKRNEPPVPQAELARRFTRFQAALGLLDMWRAFQWSSIDGRGELSSSSIDGPSSSSEALTALRRELEVWDGYARAAAKTVPSAPLYIAGGERPSMADFAFWPVLHDIMTTQPEVISHCKHLDGYYFRLKKSKAGIKVSGGGDAKDRLATSQNQ